MKNEYDEDIKNALTALKAGKVILYPTDTIWGLGCDPTNAGAVAKIFQIKQRADTKSMIVLVNSTEMLQRYVSDIPEVALDMVELTDTPLTVVYDKGRSLAPGVTAEDGSVGARLCLDPFCDDLITAFRKPLVSTSANISGQPAPSTFDEISEEIKDAVDYICQYRQNDQTRSKPSSVIKISSSGAVKILRD
ncbi:MAG TPA: L-threonylcarbamoyladenylate synthase [Bacteroidales bacterium]|nr:L-threonylcarbamoyladenylate synthase [Bacteroidales bacterium]HPT12570.1 L-threonylcarbamoyladenylate synthase [Bacteroidales bacterium]